MSKNKIKVKVCGTEFNILSEDNEEYTQKIASVVDRKMKQTLETNPRVSIYYFWENLTKLYNSYSEIFQPPNQIYYNTFLSNYKAYN